MTKEANIFNSMWFLGGRWKLRCCPSDVSGLRQRDFLPEKHRLAAKLATKLPAKAGHIAPSASAAGVRSKKLPIAPGITTSNKKLLVTT